MKVSSERTKTIHIWCGPRSLSTATMYSFSSRPDTTVLDEPLYGYYLAQHPEAFRPYREEMLSKTNCDGVAVAHDIQSMYDTCEKIVVAKHIIKHICTLDPALFVNENTRHVFLVRNPMEMILSWTDRLEVHQDECSLKNTNLPIMVDLFSTFTRLCGREPVVVDSNLLASHPREVLHQLCSELNIPYCEEQLSWPVGPKPFDGLWAPYWYAQVHSSSGFNTGKKDREEVPRSYPTLTIAEIEVYRQAAPFFEFFRHKTICYNSLCTATSSSNLMCCDIPSMDVRNRDILVWVGDRLLPREMAKMSVFDSSVQGGDAVWEGIRVYDGKVFKLEEHLQRLMDSAKALAFDKIPTKEFIRQSIFKTLAANGMRDHAHMRLTLTRGVKWTSSMNPVFNIFGATLIILAEWKPVGNAATYDNRQGIQLITACNRRNPPQCVDSKIHHNNLINNILPKIQANVAGVADALMLDTEGFVSETNATNVFMVKDNVVLTPHADYCLPGITRKTIIELAQSLGLEMVIRRISLTEFYCADEVFTTGTMGELTPVVGIDGRTIGTGVPGAVTGQLQRAFRELTLTQGVPLP